MGLMSDGQDVPGSTLSFWAVPLTGVRVAETPSGISVTASLEAWLGVLGRCPHTWATEQGQGLCVIHSALILFTDHKPLK